MDDEGKIKRVRGMVSLLTGLDWTGLDDDDTNAAFAFFFWPAQKGSRNMWDGGGTRSGQILISRPGCVAHGKPCVRVAGQLLFLNIVGKMTAFLFLALLGTWSTACSTPCPVRDVPLCVCSHYGRQGGRGGRSLVPVQVTTGAEGLTRMWEPTMGPHRRRTPPTGT